jgi:uncharacterized protein YecE (DUF72 family)
MGWSYKFWVGKLYPEDTKPTEYLTEYAKAMNSVEVDATFYRIPSVSTVEAWREAVPEGFRFAAKFPQTVTHAPRLIYDAEKLDFFLHHIEAFGSKLGPLLLQFPPSLKPAYPALNDLLEAIPKNRLIATEFRNKHWFTEETYKMLRDHGVALASTNREGVPEVDTAEFAYIRWEGDRRVVVAERGEVQVDRSAETVGWVSMMKKHLEARRDIYGYFSKFYSGYPPSDVKTLRNGL